MSEKQVLIRVKDFDYVVTFVDEDHKELRSKDENIEYFGKTDCTSQVIYIRKDLRATRLLKVIIHEITHAYLDAYGFTETKTFNEEQVATFLETYAQDIVESANYVMKGYLGNG